MKPYSARQAQPPSEPLTMPSMTAIAEDRAFEMRPDMGQSLKQDVDSLAAD
jgi:hypothetical protein